MTAKANIRRDGPEQAHVRTVELQVGQNLSDAINSIGVQLDMRCSAHGVCKGCEVVIDGEHVRSCQHSVHEGVVLDVLVPSSSVLTRDALTADEFALPIKLGETPLMRTGEDDLAKWPYALAVDIGTTTVAAILLDRTTGKSVARGGALNQQSIYGDNVITRIQRAMNDPEDVAKMQHAVLDLTLGRIIKKICREHVIDPAKIGVVVVVGNTTMLHLCTGIDPSPMGIAPFTPAFIDYRVEPISQGWCGVEGCSPEVHLLPGASAYVGADATAGALACNLTANKGPALLIDIGTNGEMLLWDDKQLWGTATAAGPAFEGVGLTNGVRATPRAIARIEVDTRAARIIGHTVSGETDVEPTGLCGSAYVDLMAAGAQADLLSPTGRLTPQANQHFAHQIETTDHNERVIKLLPKCKKDTSSLAAHWSKASVSERDLASVLQAKAAIQAGAQVLMNLASIKPDNLQRIYVAGGFGSHLDTASAVAIGLLPPVQLDRITPLGNSALAGAAIVALDHNKLANLTGLAADIRVHTLGHDDDFEDRFVSCMTIRDGMNDHSL